MPYEDPLLGELLERMRRWERLREQRLREELCLSPDDCLDEVGWEIFSSATRAMSARDASKLAMDGNLRTGARQLPTSTDRARILSLAPDSVLVGHGAAKPEGYDRAVERTLKEVAELRRVAKGRMGHARARCAPSDSRDWRVEMVRGAQRLSAVA
jgi:hypothetical protein